MPSDPSRSRNGRRNQTEAARTLPSEGRTRLVSDCERLARRLVQSEEERRLLIYDLHDGPVQQLTAAQMHLECYRARRSQNEDPKLAVSLETVADYLAMAVREMRRIMCSLRPAALDPSLEGGLAGALRRHLALEARRAGREISFATNLSDERLEAAPETAVFHIAQEAVANALQHARCHRIDVNLKKDHTTLVLEVKDEGVGFDESRLSASPPIGRGLGLLSMRERTELLQGQLRVVTAPGMGTTVIAKVPLATKESPPQADGSASPPAPGQPVPERSARSTRSLSKPKITSRPSLMIGRRTR